MIGIFLAFIEIVCFTLISYSIQKYTNLKTLNKILYYWVCFTILTGIWELFFIINYNKVTKISLQLLKNQSHVWTNDYSINYILPWNFSQIFYAEYGAYADREYMSSDDWSRVIESSHCLLCGLFALFSLLFKYYNINNEYLITLSISMGGQLMNSILYLFNYFYQSNQSYSVNYNSQKFPLGLLCTKRPFMYINIFWTLCPLYIIIILMKINNFNINIKS